MADIISSPQSFASQIAGSFTGWIASLPNRRRGQLIDLLVCLGGVLLVGPLSRVVERQGLSFNGPDLVRPGGRTLGYLLVAAFVAHGVGAYLKREPLQARFGLRLANEGPRKKSRPGFLSEHLGIVILLATLHFALFFILLGEGWKGAGLQSLLPLYYGSEKLRSDWLAAPHVALTLIVGFLPTAMVLRALIPLKPGNAALWRKQWLPELIADVALGFSIMVVTLVWSILILPGMAIKISPSDNLVLVALLIPLLAVPFILFYITPRGLFLVEEYRDPRAWLTIFVAMLPLAKVVVVGT